MEQHYDQAACGLLTTDTDGTILAVNQTLLTWIGAERSDLVGRRTFADLLTAGGRIYHETHLRTDVGHAGHRTRDRLRPRPWPTAVDSRCSSTRAPNRSRMVG